MATATAPTPPRTLDGVVLLGWMDRAAAIKFLCDDCIFDHQLTDQEAEGIWSEYRRRAEVLPEREALAPQLVDLTAAEQAHADRFMAFLQQVGITEIQRVIKIDPFQLVARQYHIVSERSEGYRQKCPDDTTWMEECLPTTLTSPQITITATQKGLNTAADIDLPHAEFSLFGPDPNGMFRILQWGRYVTVMNVGPRMLLWAGYHRSYARMLSTTPTAADRSALFALTSKTLVPPNPATGVTAPWAGAGLDIFGRRPALLADFFTDGLFMRVNLRKKRYQLQVRSTWVALDDSAP